MYSFFLKQTETDFPYSDLLPEVPATARAGQEGSQEQAT